MPANRWSPGDSVAPSAGTSMRAMVLTIPSLFQLRCSYQPAYSWVIARMPASHLGFFMPYRPGTRSRAGKPCSRGSGWPFISYTTSDSGSSLTSLGKPAENSSLDSSARPTALDFRPPARSSTSCSRAPRQRAVEIRSQPNVVRLHSAVKFEMHSSVLVTSTEGRPRRVR